MDMKLELIVVPSSDVDHTKEFYEQKMGFHLDVDFSAGENFRVVQLTPPGSACSIAVMKNVDAAGSLNGLHLIVEDIEAAHAELVKNEVDTSDYFYFGENGQTTGLHPERASYGTFFSFGDPDGNGWLVQEVKRT